MLMRPKRLGLAILLLTCFPLALTGVRADDLAPQLTAAALESLGNRQGSVIVIDPHSGRVLVLVHEDIALQSAYLPGSLFKIVTAAAALEEGLVDEHSTVNCQGSSVFYGRPLYCWYRPGHGSVNIRKALALSCNVYFYHLGQQVGAHNLLTYAARFKLGETTGINKPGEVSGSLPTWVPDQEVPVLAVGQSKALAVTPIQVAGLIAAIANGGFFYQPYAPTPDNAVDDFQPVLRGRIELSQALEIIREGLRESADYGTSIASSPGLEAVAGKTGTASQVQGGKTDAWFAGYFPAERPEIALVVFVRSGTGAVDAAPVAAHVLKSYLKLRHAMLLPPAGPAPQSTVRVSILTRHHPTTLRLTPSGGGATLYAAAGGVPWRELRDGEAIRITRQGAELAISGAGAQAVLLSQLRLSPLQQHVMLKAELPGGLVRSYYGELALRAGVGELEIINLVQEDDYLASVVHSEMGHAPLQALKAQALVSRTFLAQTLARHTGPYDVTDLTAYQTYGGALSETPLSRQAIEETAGEVLTFRGELITPLFHSTSGGYTLDAFDVWGREKIPYLVAVRDGEGVQAYCEMSPHFRWRGAVDKNTVHQILAKAYGLADTSRLIEVRKVEPSRQDIENYPGKIELVGTGLQIRTDQFRLDINRVLGWHTIKSNRFTIDLIGSQYQLVGNGLGHGVGMCQWGAKGMAEKGYDYRQIVAHYYSGVEITHRSR